MAMPEQDDRVERVERTEYPPAKAARPSGGIKQLLMMVAISAAVSFALLVVWAMPQMVTKSDFTKNIQNMSVDVASAKTLASNLSTQITAVSTSVQLITSDVATIKGAYTTATAVNGLIANQINPIQQSLNSLKSTVDGLPKSQPDIAPLKTQITALQTSLDAIKVDVAALKAPTVPVVSLPSITSFTPTSGVVGTSIVITGTNFNAASSVTVGSVAATFVVNSTTQITAIVGTGAVTGAVNVTTPAGAVGGGTFTVTGTTTTPTTGITASIVGSSTLSLSSTTGNTVNIGISNGTSKAVYAEQISLTLQFLNPPSAISTWGLVVAGGTGITTGSPSYSIVPGIVSYLINAGAYITPGTSQTIGITVTTPSLAVYPVNFIATVSVSGYSALP